MATLCGLVAGIAMSSFDILAGQGWNPQPWSTNQAVPSLAADLPIGPLAHYELSGGTGTNIPNLVTGGGALPGLILYGGDFRRAGSDLFLNENIPNPIQVFPFDPNRGTFAYSTAFTNTFSAGGVWALRLRVASTVPTNLAQGSSAAIVTFRPSPEVGNNPHRVPPRSIEFHRDGPTDPLHFLVREGANSIGYNNEFNDEVRSQALTNLTVDRTVVIAFDPQRLRIFVDGVPHGTTNRQTVDNPAAAYSLQVGAQSSLIHGQDRQFYQGALRSLVVYSRTLSDQEIGDLSFALSGTVGPPPTDCVVSTWSNWQPTSAFSACTNNQQSRNEERTRTIQTLPQNGGLACPALTETRVFTQPCTAGGGTGISVTPPSASITTPHGTAPAPITLTVSTPNGVGFSTQESSTFFDASCFNITCPSGGTVTVNLSGVFFSNADPGTYSSPLTIHANGFASVVVPITIVVSSSSGGPGPGPGPGPVGAPPAAPRRFWPTVRQNSVSLGWQAPISGGTPSGYVVEAGMASGQTIHSFPVGLLTNVDVPNVGPGRYYVRVKAVNALGVSPASNEEVVTVGCSGAPAAPQSLTAVVNGNAVSLHWADGEGCSDTRYRLRVGSAPGLTNVVDFPVETTEIATLAPPGTYYVRVVKTTPLGESPASNEVVVTVGAGVCAPPTFATELDIQLSGRHAAALWRPVNEAAAIASDSALPIGYLLEVGSVPGQANLGSSPMGRTLSVSAPVGPGTFYVRVRPTNACGAGPASNEVTLHVP